MKKVINTPKFEEENKEGYYSECVYVFEYEDGEEEDFQLLSHNEQLQLCGFKVEEKTPMDSGTVHRYFIDAGDVYVIIRECIYGW